MKKILKTSLKLLFSIILLFILFRKFNMNVSVFYRKIDRPFFLILAIIISLAIIPLFSINRWKQFLKQVNINEKFFALWNINFISSFQSLVLPSTQGIDLLRIYHIEMRHPDKKGRAGSTVLIERMFGLVLLLFFSAAAMPFVMDRNDIKVCALILCAIILITMIGIIAVTTPFFYRICSKWQTRFSLINACLDYIRRVHNSLICFPYRKIFISSVLLIAGYQFSIIFACYCVFSAFGVHIGFWDNLAVYPVVSILAIVPITIGGFGVREGLFVYFYSRLGVPAEIAITVSIVNYAVLCLLHAAVGGILWSFECLGFIKKIDIPQEEC